MTLSLRSLLWVGTLVLAATTLLSCWQAALVLAPGSRILAIAFGSAALICCVRPPATFGSKARLVQLLECLLLFTIISALGAILTYVAMRQSGGGWTDALLDHADRALGFRWPAIHAFVDSRPWLDQVLLRAYLSFSSMPFLLFGLLYWAGRTDHMYRYLLAHGLAMLATIAIFRFFPAQAAFSFYRDHGVPLTGSLPHYDATIDGLRDGSLTTMDLTHLDGIVTFPSFHASMAILFVWGAWPGARWWRGPLLVVNGLMWAAAVPIGGHYVVDLIGGSAIAAAAIGVTGGAKRARNAASVSTAAARSQPTELRAA